MCSVVSCKPTLTGKISGVTSGGGMGSMSNTVTVIIHYTMYWPTYNKNKHKVSSCPQYEVFNTLPYFVGVLPVQRVQSQPPDDMPGVEGWLEGERVTALLHYESGSVRLVHWSSPRYCLKKRREGTEG